MTRWAAALATALNLALLATPLFVRGALDGLGLSSLSGHSGPLSPPGSAGAWLFLLLIMAFTFGEGICQRPGPLREAPQPLAALTGVTLFALFMSGALTSGRAGPWALGAALMSAGIGLRLVAIRALGTRFANGVQVETAAPVRTGPYRYLRHPSELGLLLIGLGASGLLASWVAAAMWGFGLLPLVLLRVRREDAALRAAFGEAYAQYASRVPGLFPLNASWARSWVRRAVQPWDSSASPWSPARSHPHQTQTTRSSPPRPAK